MVAMTGATYEPDVLIVGGGPVGMALALDLTYRNVNFMVIDAGDGSVSHPKVSTVGPRSMELFRRWGIADKIRCGDMRTAELYEYPFVLVRPDRHVAWRGNDPPLDASRLVDKVHGVE
jgi:2-polyprenyl-6-methoxyphenol hydroxylase-like FAD-dependent oxidoreductase